MKIFILIKTILFSVISFYGLALKDIHGNDIDFNSFKGKKVLIVNTNTTTADTVQYNRLELLYQKYKDSLVIIAIPSNSFGHTPGNSDSALAFINSHYSLHYLVAEKIQVKGDSAHAIYKWLQDINKNSMISDTVKGEFRKYLINKDGLPIGVYSRSIDPFGEQMQQAIEQ